MNNKLLVLVFFAIAIIFLLSACNLFGGGQPNNLAVTLESLRTGTDALVMSFYPGSPPNQSYESNSASSSEGVFTVALVLENKGATDITNGKLVLSYDDTFLNNLPQSWVVYDMATSETGNSFKLNIDGKSLQAPEGETQIYSKNFKTKMIEEQQHSKDVSFIATACYNYQTKASVPVCIDSAPFQKTKKPCTMKSVSLSSQGAPLVITRVEPSLVPQGNSYQLQVLIYMKNNGKGEVYKNGGTNIACAGGSQSQKDFWNVIDTINMRLGTDTGSNQFKCDLPLKLEKGKESFVRCVYNNAIFETPPYTTPLFVELSYGYSQSISTTMTILKRSII